MCYPNYAGPFIGDDTPSGPRYTDMAGRYYRDVDTPPNSSSETHKSCVWHVSDNGRNMCPTLVDISTYDGYVSPPQCPGNGNDPTYDTIAPD